MFNMIIITFANVFGISVFGVNFNIKKA